MSGFVRLYILATIANHSFYISYTLAFGAWYYHHDTNTKSNVNPCYSGTLLGFNASRVVCDHQR